MNILDRLMSPLSKNHCLFFYGYGLVALFFALISILIIVRGLYNITVITYNKTPINRGLALYILGLFIMSFFNSMILYYVNRIQYSMCIAVLR